jgi:hypothetical protein
MVQADSHSGDYVPKDEELLLRLRNFEDHFVERKTLGDKKDWRKTVVAFANSTPVGYPSVLFIGVRDDGTIEDGVNLDTLQKKLGTELDRIYPHPYYLSRVLSEKGKQFLAVIVPGSNDRPHFAGLAYVREGSKTIEASSALFQQLIEERLSKVHELRQWIGKQVVLERWESSMHGTRATGASGVVIRDCNQFYFTYDAGSPGFEKTALPLSRTDISYDHTHNCLKLEVRTG